MESKNYPKGRVTYIFEFEIVPGKEDEFWKYMEEEGTPFWLSFPEVESYTVYSKMGGHGGYEGHVVIKEFALMDKINSHPNCAAVGKRCAELTQNFQRRFLLLSKVYVKE